MDSSLKVQVDIKNHAEDLQKCMLDLRNWEQEMKRKETALKSDCSPSEDFPPPRNKRVVTDEVGASTVKSTSKPARISSYDYAAWEKFNIDEACAEIDEDTSDCPLEYKETSKVVHANDDDDEEEGEDNRNEISKNMDRLQKIDQAAHEKELGNNYVKQGKWVEAIQCYTKALEWDSKNPIFYANRALCFLKVGNFRAAETDSTAAIQLDNSYVKAFLRRATARQALGQFTEAKDDYNEILKLEPKNTVALNEIRKIEGKVKTNLPPLKQQKTTTKNNSTAESSSTKAISKPKEEKTVSGKSIKPAPTAPVVLFTENKNEVSEKQQETVHVDNPDNSRLNHSPPNLVNTEQFYENILPISKPAHARSKKPLMRISVQEITPTSKVIAAPPVCQGIISTEENSQEILHQESDEFKLEVPKSSIQFKRSWKHIKNNSHLSYEYLKMVFGQDLLNICGDDLESDTLSELFSGLANSEALKDVSLLHFFLSNITKVKRFRSLVLFMTAADKTNVKLCLTALQDEIASEELINLEKSYQL